MFVDMALNSFLEGLRGQALGKNNSMHFVLLLDKVLRKNV